MPFNDPELDRLGDARRSLKEQRDAYKAEMDQIIQDIESITTNLGDFQAEIEGLKESIAYWKPLRDTARRNGAWDDVKAYGEGIDRNYEELERIRAATQQRRELRELLNEAKDKRREAADAYGQVNEEFQSRLAYLRGSTPKGRPAGRSERGRSRSS
jgi:phage shock protein A